MSKTLDRITALLAKAESTDSAAERDACMGKAQHLATLAAIDLETARARQRSRGKMETPITRSFVMFTGPQARMIGRASFIRLFLAIASVNSVTCNIYHDSSGVIAFGYASDIDVAQALYGSLSVQMKSAADAYLATGDHKQELVQRYERRSGMYVLKPMSGRTARCAFYEEFVREVRLRLESARGRAVSEAEEEHGPGTGLVLVSKTDRVRDYYQQNSRARGSWRGNAAAQASSGSSARRAGARSGREARLGAPAAVTGGKGAVTA